MTCLFNCPCLRAHGEGLIFVELVVHMPNGIEPLLANLSISPDKGILWHFFLVLRTAVVEILTFDPRGEVFMPDCLVSYLSNESELSHPFKSRLKHSGELQLIINSASNTCWVVVLILLVPKSCYH